MSESFIYHFTGFQRLTPAISIIVRFAVRFLYKSDVISTIIELESLINHGLASLARDLQLPGCMVILAPTTHPTPGQIPGQGGSVGAWFVMPHNYGFRSVVFRVNQTLPIMESK